MRKPVIVLLKAYKLLISPFMGQNCRFHPSCASYTIEAVERHGVIRGLFLGVRRVIKCQPWSVGGYDPVPELTGHCKHGEIAPDIPRSDCQTIQKPMSGSHRLHAAGPGNAR